MNEINLEHFRKSPFYEGLFSTHPFFSDFPNCTRSQFRRWITELPLLSRNDLQPDIISRLVSTETHQSLNPVWSTGTSGTPIRVFRNENDELRFWNLLKTFGSIHKNELHVLFLCVLEKGQSYRQTIEWPSFKVHVHRHNIYVSKKTDLPKIDPDIITTSTDGLYWMKQNKMEFQKPASCLIYSTALSISTEFFLEVKTDFDCPVFHSYSTTETGPIAYFCPISGLYHCFEDVFVETIDGKLILSKLFSSALPLLRYQTQDSGHVDEFKCACGFEGQSIQNLLGRKASQLQ